MKAPSNNNPMWIAITVIGGIVAYSMLKKDVAAVADKAADGVKYVADKANPLSQTNVLNSVITSTGEAIVGEPWSFGTQIHKWFGKNGNYDWEKPSQTKSKAKPTNEKTTVTTAKNHRGARVNPPIEDSTPKLSTASNHRGAADSTQQSIFKNPQKTGITDTSPNIPAKNFNGQWKKLINGLWLPLTRSDKVVTIRGVNVVKPFLWKP